VHTCLVCLSPIADPDHLSDLMSDTASAVHHADLPMSATLSPRRPLGDIARECGEAIMGGDSSQVSLRQCMDSLTGESCGLFTSFSHLPMAEVLETIAYQAGVPFSGKDGAR
jgi:hypothetical protein